MFFRSKLDSQSQIGTVEVEDHVNIEIDAEDGKREFDDNRSDFQANHSHQQVPLLRMVGDGYNWRKYEDKVVKGSANQLSYYKCTQPTCYVKKKVERTIEGEIVDIHYQGTHTHCERMHNMKRNSSSEYLYSVLPSEPVTFPDQSFASQGNGELDYHVQQQRTPQYPNEI